MRILVADDDEDTRQSCRELLELDGHEVCSAADGQQAVDLAKMFLPELAMLDIGMPRLTGFEAAKQIRAALPNVTLVAVTGWQARKDAQAEGDAFDHYVLKPVSPSDLCRLMHRELS
jgi:CheY-like chemotaxis protein